MDDSTIVRINLLLKKFGKKFQPFASVDLSMSWAYGALPVGALLALLAVLAHHLDPRSDELEMAQ